jgi:hypothetical protein
VKDRAMTIHAFATWDSPAERERETPQPQTFAKRSASRQRKRKKENRERTTGTESHTLFALDAETTTGVAEMENIFERLYPMDDFRG